MKSFARTCRRMVAGGCRGGAGPWQPRLPQVVPSTTAKTCRAWSSSASPVRVFRAKHAGTVRVVMAQARDPCQGWDLNSGGSILCLSPSSRRQLPSLEYGHGAKSRRQKQTFSSKEPQAIGKSETDPS